MHKANAKKRPAAAPHLSSACETDVVENIVGRYSIGVSAANSETKRKGAHSCGYHQAKKQATESGLTMAEARAKAQAFAKLVTTRFDECNCTEP